MELSWRRLSTVVIVVLIVSSFFLCYDVNSEVSEEAPNAYRAITHLHTCFSHDARFGSEPSLQLNNLQERGYQVVLVSEHDYSTTNPVQTDFNIPPLVNGGFEHGSPDPSRWRPVVYPRNSSVFLNSTDSSKSLEGKHSFHLKLEGTEDDFDLLSWSYREIGSQFTRDRPIAYNLWLKFSIFFSESIDSFSDSVVYVSISLGRKNDPMFPEVSNKLSFYFATETSTDKNIPDLYNVTNQLSIRLDSPRVGKWRTYNVNLTDYAFRFLPRLGDVSAKYLMLRQLTLSLASRNGSPVEIWADDFQVYSEWTSKEMYDWWKRDIEGYSTQDFLVIAGLETSVLPHIGAYGLTEWHNFTVYESVEERVRNIQAMGAISTLAHPRASNFTYVSEGRGWSAELFEVFTTVHDQKPSAQVLSLWDDFLSKGSILFAVAGLDSHGLLGVPGSSQPTVVRDPIYENLIIADSLNRESVLSAIRHGRMYIIRSDQALRMSFSAGVGGPQQGDGVVYTSANTGAVISVWLEGVSRGSELLVIQNGSIVSKIGLDGGRFSQEMRFPLAGMSSYLRLEVHQGDKLVAISNPLFFHQANLPSDVWAALDPSASSSKVSSIQGNDGEVDVQLHSTTGSSSWINLHIPSCPTKAYLENMDYSKNSSLNKDALSALDQGWTYNENTRLLTAKITHRGLGTIYIVYGNSNTKPSMGFINIIYAIIIASTIAFSLLIYYSNNKTHASRAPISGH